jgi:hypothetical protein
MKKALLLILIGLIACSGHKIAGAQALSIPHPDDPAKKVEYFLEKPKRRRTVAHDRFPAWSSGLATRGRKRFCEMGRAG